MAVNAKRAAALAKKIGIFPDIVTQASEQCKPSVIAKYLIELGQMFNTFYTECPVLKAEEKLMAARILLCDATRQVLANGLCLLGMKAPEEM